MIGWWPGHNFSVVARSLLISTINLGLPRDFNELRVAKISRFATSALTAGKQPLDCMGRADLCVSGGTASISFYTTLCSSYRRMARHARCRRRCRRESRPGRAGRRDRDPGSSAMSASGGRSRSCVSGPGGPSLTPMRHQRDCATSARTTLGHFQCANLTRNDTRSRNGRLR